NVTVIGTIGILDQLLDGGYITESDYEFCLIEWEKRNGQEVRLPKGEITLRFQRLKNKLKTIEKDLDIKVEKKCLNEM
ncbi:MAG TPA: hypothetical protein PLR73_13890, partial [Acetivibrio sp.]|nr:hypothetical protein [Acetivibrio sp.]